MALGLAVSRQVLSAGARAGRVKVSVVDRYAIVVMGGIAAEALCYAAAEGGRDDERELERLLVERLGAEQRELHRTWGGDPR